MGSVNRQHLDCLRVAHLVYRTAYAGNVIHLSGRQIIQRAVADDWGGALERGCAHLALVQSERAQAERAAALLERWAAGKAAEAAGQPMQIGQVARLLDISRDVLRNWERNGFIAIPRNTNNRYRVYGPAEISRLRVIRVLGRAGYSQMAILRMLIQLDQGVTTHLRHWLDTPAPDEDVYTAADRWLSTLADQEEIARRLIAIIEEVITARATPSASPPEQPQPSLCAPGF